MFIILYCIKLVSLVSQVPDYPCCYATPLGVVDEVVFPFTHIPKFLGKIKNFRKLENFYTFIS
jgi:hypothetical protein